ncbi:hypothetical protein [Thalassospira marina]|uniref:hypothetical protein n=1 Tax=Thalassospira marina TaxID=2048283 RepID=UPI0012FF539A|nr:hypothetical protein [Thalassospira marina]
MTDKAFGRCFAPYALLCGLMAGLLALAGCDPELPPPGGRPITSGSHAPLHGATEFCARNPEADQCS